MSARTFDKEPLSLIGLRNILRGIEHFQMCKSWRKVALVKIWQDFNCLCGNKGSFWGGRGVNNQWTGAVRRGIIPSISGLISCAVSCPVLCAVFFCVLFSVFISCRLPRWTTWWTTPRSVPHCLHLAHPESSCFHLKAKQCQVSRVSTTILVADKGRWLELRPREIKCFVQKWHCDPYTANMA